MLFRVYSNKDYGGVVAAINQRDFIGLDAMIRLFKMKSICAFLNSAHFQLVSGKNLANPRNLPDLGRKR